jgi:hypothetical protein
MSVSRVSYSTLLVQKNIIPFHWFCMDWKELGSSDILISAEPEVSSSLLL